MQGFRGLVLQEQHHLKWRALDPLEHILMVLCGVAIAGFCILVMCDIVTRSIGRPWLWLQEATMTFFIYGIFFGVAAATRRNDHLYLAALAESMTGNRRLLFEIFVQILLNLIVNIILEVISGGNADPVFIGGGGLSGGGGASGSW